MNNADFPDPTLPAIPINYPFLASKSIFFKIGCAYVVIFLLYK
jgi:hypothetical protein